MWLFRKKSDQTVFWSVHQNNNSEVNGPDEPCSSAITPDNEIPIDKLYLLQEKYKNATNIYETLNRLKPKAVDCPFATDSVQMDSSKTEQIETVAETTDRAAPPNPVICMKNEEWSALAAGIESMKNSFVQMAEAVINNIIHSHTHTYRCT